MEFPLTDGPYATKGDPIERLVSVFKTIQPLENEIFLAWRKLVYENEHPGLFNCVRQEIADSWLRSINSDIPFDKNLSDNKVSPAMFKTILKENEFLLNAAKTVINKDFPLLKLNTQFSVYLFDRNSTVLFSISNKENKQPDLTGLRLSEQTVGTNSNSLSILLNKPFLTTSKEYFNKYLQEIYVAVSVPVHDSRKEAAGALTFAFYKDSGSSFTNAVVLRTIISFQLNLVNKIEFEIKKARRISSIFQLISLLNSDSLILVNKDGAIQKMNSTAEKLLGASEKAYKGKSITKVFGKDKILLDTLRANKMLSNYPVHFVSQGNEKKCVLQTVPCDLIDGALIRMNEQNTTTGNAKKLNKNVLNAKYVFSDILGDSPELTKTKNLAKKYALTSHNILLLGESGTGKELFAHAIHNMSSPEGPFISINCAALPKELIESELFGYEGGSFTGADPKGRPGKLELANGGTLFLDEIGDMPLELQPILLRVLESKRHMRIGGNRYIHSSFRVICATNRNIQELVEQNKFREDLYYRLSSLKLMIPPLRNRGRDIVMLARHFIRKECEENHLLIPKIESKVYKALLSYDWPGNIRELQNTIITALSLSENNVITAKDLPPEIFGEHIERKNNQISGLKSLEVAEIKAIIDALTKTGYNIKQAAKTLGISRTTLYKKLKKYNINTAGN